jgi:hypothetical protein
MVQWSLFCVGTGPVPVPSYVPFCTAAPMGSLLPLAIRVLAQNQRKFGTQGVKEHEFGVAES